MARNPQDDSQDSDAILYASIDTVTGAKTKPVTVLAETKGAWDAAFTCNPRVIRGSFDNPLGDGVTYTYAMYYVATSDFSGVNNSIGAAFSNDGMQWKKYPSPVVPSDSASQYGIAQPALYNVDGKSNLILFYEDITSTVRHVKATSSDGIHFTRQGELTRKGLDPNNPAPSWGDFGYDPETGYWYATFNLPVRDSATTGGISEAGQYGIQLFRIPDAALLDGSSSWEPLKTFDTNATGYESNFLAALLKDGNGSVKVGAYPTIQLYPSIANPRDHWDDAPKTLADRDGVIQWDIGSFTWKPNDTVLTLTRYHSAHIYDTTTGYVDPDGHFFPDKTIGHLYAAPQNGATLPLFNCKKSAKDYFISTDPLCAGSYIVGLEGYGYAQPSSSQSTVSIYSCNSAKQGHFASQDAQCEGSGTGTLLGYAMP